MTETTVYTREEILTHRKEWLAELRSGKRRQTKGVLKSRNGSYCCLGVACDLAAVPVVYNGSYYFGKTDIPEDEYSSPIYEPSEAELPRDVQEWLGVEDLSSPGSPTLDILPVIGDLPAPEGANYYTYDFNPASLNDELGLTFSQIADMIEYFGFQGDELGFK